MKRAKRIVHDMLIRHPHLRDNDWKLIASVWQQELIDKDLDPQTMTGHELLKMYADQKLTNAETIRRTRAKLQETDIHCRGDVWWDRNDEGRKTKTDIVKM
jgi:hypothetical protein